MAVCDLRDNQLSRVYEAEGVVIGALIEDNDRLHDADHIVDYLNHILMLKMVRRHYPKCFGDTKKQILVDYTTRRGWSEACDEVNLIFSHANANTYIVVHELAHIVQYRMFKNIPVAAHGPEFVTIYLDLLRKVFGVQTYELFKESFDVHKVKYLDRSWLKTIR